jgi:hypothetical protein
MTNAKIQMSNKSNNAKLMNGKKRTVNSDMFPLNKGDTFATAKEGD